MSYQEENIRRITEELYQLPEQYLENVYAIIHTLRTSLPATPEQPAALPGQQPFVDEIERVQQQSRSIPGRTSGSSFT